MNSSQLHEAKELVESLVVSYSFLPWKTISMWWAIGLKGCLSLWISQSRRQDMGWKFGLEVILYAWLQNEARMGLLLSILRSFVDSETMSANEFEEVVQVAMDIHSCGLWLAYCTTIYISLRGQPLRVATFLHRPMRIIVVIVAEGFMYPVHWRYILVWMMPMIAIEVAVICNEGLGWMRNIGVWTNARPKTMDEFDVFSSFGAQGTDDGQMRYPSGVAIGTDNTIYVCDQKNRRIQCFAPNGSFLRKWGPAYGPGGDEFTRPVALAIGMCEGVNKAVLKTMYAVPSLYAFPPGVLSICAAYVGDEPIVVVDDNRIHVFTTDGSFVRSWGSFGVANAQFNYPFGCCIDDRRGLIYIVDTGNHRVQAFSMDGTFIRKWGTKGDGDGQFFCPNHITVTAQGIVYVCDSYHHRISSFNLEGRLIGHTRVRGHVNAVLVNEKQELYTCRTTQGVDYGIDYYRYDGTFVKTLQWAKYPTAIAGVTNGFICVVEGHDDRITVLQRQMY